MKKFLAAHPTILHNTTAPAPRRLYDVVALALMVIEHDSEETFNLSHQVPAPYRVEVRRPLFMGQASFIIIHMYDGQKCQKRFNYIL